MTELHLPWLAAATLVPLVGALVVGRLSSFQKARKCSLTFLATTLACTVGASIDFILSGGDVASDRWNVFPRWLKQELFVIDPLSAPLLVLAPLLYFLTALATLGAKVRRFSFAANLLAQSLLVAAFSCRSPWWIIAFLSLGTLPPLWDLRNRHKPMRIYVMHTTAYVVLLLLGWWMASVDVFPFHASAWRLAPLLLAVLIRCGMAPFHCWITDLFEHASFGTALVFVTPMTGVYIAVRLILPHASPEIMHTLGVVASVTALYTAGMALVQHSARRFFCYILLSHASLVLVGLQTATPIGLTASLLLWLSMGLSLAGFGLTLRALEARHGRLSLVGYHGLYEHTPMLAICFLLTGMGSVGFPGTVGFVGAELLVHGVIESYPYFGVAIVIAAALNGIAVVQAYFKLFTGTKYIATVPLAVRGRERFAVLTLAALIIGGGLYPQPGIASRHHAAELLLSARRKSLPSTESANSPSPPPHAASPSTPGWLRTFSSAPESAP